MQKMYKGLENKIISLQQKIDEFAKDNQQLRRQNAEIPNLQKKLDASKHFVEDFNKQSLIIKKLEEDIQLTRKQLDNERDEKLAILDEKTKDESELKQKLDELTAEKEELSIEIDTLKENAKQLEIVSSQRNRILQDIDNNEIHQAYLKMTKEKELLENENRILNAEINRLIDIAPPQSNVTHSRSASNVSSINIEDDYGYASAKNTLELKRERDKDNNNLLSIPVTPLPHASKDKSKAHNDISNGDHSIEMFDGFNKSSDASTPKRSDILTILKLRKILDDEITKRKSIEKQLKRTQGKLTNLNISTQDSLKYGRRVILQILMDIFNFFSLFVSDYLSWKSKMKNYTKTYYCYGTASIAVSLIKS